MYSSLTLRSPLSRIFYFGERIPPLRGGIVEWLRFYPVYAIRIVWKQLGFWFSDPEQRGEIAKENYKAKSFNERIDQPYGALASRKDI